MSQIRLTHLHKSTYYSTNIELAIAKVSSISMRNLLITFLTTLNHSRQVVYWQPAEGSSCCSRICDTRGYIGTFVTYCDMYRNARNGIIATAYNSETHSKSTSKFQYVKYDQSVQLIIKQLISQITHS